jgi:hypothetical protein
VVYGLQLRHQQNAEFHGILQALQATLRFGEPLDSSGGDAPFEAGLYGCSEMFVDGFLNLYRTGVLRRRVYDDLRIQRLLNETAGAGRIDEPFLAALSAAGFGSPLDAAEFAMLRSVGVFRQECRWVDGAVENADCSRAAARIDSATARRELLAQFTGRQLIGGTVLHGGFFLGPRGFYAALRDLSESDRAQFSMGGVGFINQLDGPLQALKIAQRRHARFINSTMMVTALGAAVSDALADGRVVSGVGGQYNFVAMAHSLPEARSILAVHSTREKQGVLSSNILWSYGQTTIPRHLRDIVVTEYGLADLRGRTDQDVVAALLNVTDSRFQDGLKSEAQRAAKLPPDHRIPDIHRNNTPQALERCFALPRARGLFSEFPFGTDLTREEIVLSKALTALKNQAGLPRVRAVAGAVLSRGTPAAFRPYLERMRLEAPRTREEWLWQRLLVHQLKSVV